MQGDTQKRINRVIERRSFEYLVDEAETSIDHDGGRIVDTMRDAVRALRDHGYGGASKVSAGVDEVYSDAVWFVSKTVRDAIAERSDLHRFETVGGLSIDGYDILTTPGATDDAIVLADLRVLSENPARHRSGLARSALTETFSWPLPFVVTEPTGVVVVRL